MDNNTIKSKAISSVVWKFMERIGAQLVSMIVAIIIARILSPEDYSVVSLVTIFFTFANILISGGFNASLIQKKNADAEDYSVVLYISLICSIVIYVILFFTAPWISRIYRQPSIILIIRVMGLSLPVNAVKSIWCAYISANLDFKKFFFSTLGGTIASAFIGIGMALNGAGAWALVAQQMTNICIDTLILICTTRIKFVRKISFDRVKSLFKYGWGILLSSLLGTIYTQIIPLVIGVKYTAADLAFYTKGRSFPELISSTSVNTLSAVMFPTMAKFQDDKEKILQYTRLFIQVSSYLAFPSMLGLFIVSDNFIVVLLTEKWLPTSPYIKIFCVACMFDMIHIGNCETIKAIGRSDIYLVMEIIKKSAYFITVFLFLRFTNSPEMMSLSFVVCSVVAFVVNSIPNQKLIGYMIKDQLIDILPNLLTAIAMVIPCFYVGRLDMPAIILLILQIMVGTISYVLISVVTRNKNFMYIWGYIKSIRRAKHD